MANGIKGTVDHNDPREIKPAYQAPVLTELDTYETANGLIQGAPENNVTYS